MGGQLHAPIDLLIFPQAEHPLPVLLARQTEVLSESESSVQSFRQGIVPLNGEAMVPKIDHIF
jgi:hypothetical protein